MTGWPHGARAAHGERAPAVSGGGRWQRPGAERVRAADGGPGDGKGGRKEGTAGRGGAGRRGARGAGARTDRHNDARKQPPSARFVGIRRPHAAKEAAKKARTLPRLADAHAVPAEAAPQKPPQPRRAFRRLDEARSAAETKQRARTADEPVPRGDEEAAPGRGTRSAGSAAAGAAPLPPRPPPQPALRPLDEADKPPRGRDIDTEAALARTRQRLWMHAQAKRSRQLRELMDSNEQRKKRQQERAAQSEAKERRRQEIYAINAIFRASEAAAIKQLQNSAEESGLSFGTAVLHLGV